MARTAVIFNPKANHGRVKRLDLACREVLGKAADWYETHAAKHAQQLAREHGGGVDLVVAVGGDGTVHEVINGLMDLPEKNRPRLAVIPAGSGNDFALAAGIDPKEALSRVFTGKERRVDVAVLRDETGRKEYWNNTCGLGLDGKISMKARNIKRLHGFWMYFAATVDTVFRHLNTARVRLWVDDQPAVEQELLMLTLGNGPREGGGFHTTPGSRIDDGLLDYVRVGAISRWTVLGLIPKVMRGAHIHSRHVGLGSFRRLKLEADRPLPIHLDGEPFIDETTGVTYIEVEILPGALRMVV